MKCGDTCRHDNSKLNLGLSVKLLQLAIRGSGKALGDNLAGACSIFFQESFVLVRHIYWIFRLLRGGWLGCTLRQAPASDTGESQPQARSIQKRNQGVHLSCVIHRRRAERRQREHHCDDKACTVAAETE